MEAGKNKIAVTDIAALWSHQSTFTCIKAIHYMAPINLKIVGVFDIAHWHAVPFLFFDVGPTSIHDLVAISVNKIAVAYELDFMSLHNTTYI